VSGECPVVVDDNDDGVVVLVVEVVVVLVVVVTMIFGDVKPTISSAAAGTSPQVVGQTAQRDRRRLGRDRG
jgi:hypothetical protein